MPRRPRCFQFLVPVDLMPGNPDCGLPYWPQQELDEHAFPYARVWEINFETCTNPYSFQLGGLDFLVTNGRFLLEIGTERVTVKTPLFQVKM